MIINISDFLINLMIISVNKKYNTNYIRSNLNSIHFYLSFIIINLNNQHYRINNNFDLNKMDIEQIGYYET